MSTVGDFVQNYLFLITVIFGYIVGGYYAQKEAKKWGFPQKEFVVSFFLAFIVAMIGGKLLHVLLYFSDYRSDISAFFVFESGFMKHGAVIFGFLFAFFFLKYKQQPQWKQLDIAVPFVALAHGISMIGNQELGLPISSDALWTIRIDGFFYHPVQAYEFLLMFLLFGYLLLRLKSKDYHGQGFVHFLIGFFFITGIVELAKNNDRLFGVVTINQIISVIGIVVAFFLASRIKNMNRIKIPRSISKYNIAKTWFMLWSIMIVSIIVHYLVQG